MIPYARQIKLALILIAVACFVLSGVTMCAQRRTIDAQKRDIAVARETGKALDRVSAETDAIRKQQKAKEDEVEQIPGSDIRLPDGHGSALEQLRKR